MTQAITTDAYWYSANTTPYGRRKVRVGAGSMFDSDEPDGIARVETAPAVLGTVRNSRVMWPVNIVVG